MQNYKVIYSRALSGVKSNQKIVLFCLVVCPNGAPLVMCLRNMCNDGVSCPAHPQASCRMNYCGHCSVEFVFPNGTIADCDDPGECFVNSFSSINDNIDNTFILAKPCDITIILSKFKSFHPIT